MGNNENKSADSYEKEAKTEREELRWGTKWK